MELRIKKELKTTEQGFKPSLINADYSITSRRSDSWDTVYDTVYEHELKIYARGSFPSNEKPDHSIARNGLMSYLYGDVIHELNLIAMEISPRNTATLKRIRNLQHQLSSWD